MSSGRFRSGSHALYLEKRLGESEIAESLTVSGIQQLTNAHLFELASEHSPSWNHGKAPVVVHWHFPAYFPMLPTRIYKYGHMSNCEWPGGLATHTEAIANVLGGRKVLGKVVKKPDDLARLIRKGCLRVP